MLQSDFAIFSSVPRRKPLVFLLSKLLLPFVLLAFVFNIFVLGQKTEETKVEKKTDVVASPAGKDQVKAVTAEQVAESSIFVYGGFPGGREKLNQIRKTAIEQGKISVANAEGKLEQASYHKFTSRGETLGKEKIRLDQDFPKAKYSLVYNDDKIFGIFNDSVFTPREDASRTFQNQIVYGIEALLRYKENESKLELGGRDKMLGVDFYFVDVTDKQNHKTRFFVSAKTFRVMMLEYEDGGTKYRRKFYNYNYAQGTLVPYRSILWAGDKIVEETEIGTVTYGQKVDDGLFTGN